MKNLPGCARLLVLPDFHMFSPIFYSVTLLHVIVEYNLPILLLEEAESRMSILIDKGSIRHINSRSDSSRKRMSFPALYIQLDPKAVVKSVLFEKGKAP
uniref:Uncharacterized protein n=1 Tax=Oryza punctata TaxID=4537 RepID=A0A0E0KKG3_ORYPU